jgi:hypothetical protein
MTGFHLNVKSLQALPNGWNVDLLPLVMYCGAWQGHLDGVSMIRDWVVGEEV